MSRPPKPGPLAGLLLLLAPCWVVLLRTSLQALSPADVAPDALALAAAAAAWAAGPAGAVRFALVAGLLADAAGEQPFGLAAVRLALLTLAFARARAAASVDLPGAGALFVLVFALCDRLLDAACEGALAGVAEAGPLAARAACVGGLTALLGPAALGAARALLPEARR